MASFISSVFSGGGAKDAAQPALERPSTPTDDHSAANNFLDPLATPQGSPSKKTVPPGANDLPAAFDNALQLNANALSSPVKLGRPQSSGSPLSPVGKTNLQPPSDDSYFANASSAVEDSVLHKTPQAATTPRHGQENTPPSRIPVQQSHNQAAVSRQQPYHLREPRTVNTSAKKFNTTRGLTPEELEILKKPSVKRLVNVTQLCMSPGSWLVLVWSHYTDSSYFPDFLDHYFDLLTYVGSRQARLETFKSEVPPPPETDEEEYKKLWSKYAGRERAALRKRRVRLRHGDFQILTQVGQGGYGQVFLAQKKDTREVCALKVMSKKLLFKLDEVRHVLTERDILTTANSEWLVRLLYSFQDDRSIYLAMEYVPGGDFRTLLNNTGVLSNRHARFYIAEMFCSVDALHKLGYIHRDLKPENFLIDSTGHVKLTDFGLAAGNVASSKIHSMRVRLEKASETNVPFGKAIGQRTIAERREGYQTMREKDVNYAKSIVGSPDYMAPEVLRGEEYDSTVDYWSLGCMLFEALTGFPPFAGASADETWRNLKHWKDVLKRPVWEDPNYFLSNRTWSFITT